MPVGAHIEGGNIYLPLQGIGEALGYKIERSEKDGIIYVSKPGENIAVDLQNNKISVNDHISNMSGGYTGTVVSGSAADGEDIYMGADFFSDSFALKILWDKQGEKVKLESIKENALTIGTEKENIETNKIKITLQFPQIEGLDDKSVQDRINSVFKKAAEDARDEGLKNAEYLQDVDGDTGSPHKYETYFDYKLKYNQNGLLSVTFLNYQYTGGAHGLTVQSSRTFNLKTGEEYQLKDLIKSDADYVTFISGIVKKQIAERAKEGILPEQPLTPFEAIKNEQDFYLSNNGPVVYFQLYEYFPYVAGIQEFAVDFSELKDMLKPDFSFLNECNSPQEFPETNETY
ncbi:MAG: PdaC/SigV domain-containing protein [Peptococcaceae bacterium]